MGGDDKSRHRHRHRHRGEDDEGDEERRSASRSVSRHKHKHREHRHESAERHAKKKRDREHSKEERNREGHGKKRRKEKAERRSSSARSDRRSEESGEEDGQPLAPVPDLQQALVVLQQLLSEFPAIATELLALLQTLDEGETAVLSGIGNTKIKDKLKKLLTLLGLVQLRRPKDAFSARGRHDTGCSLLETVERMMSGDGESAQPSVDVSATEDEAASRRHAAPIGPTLPRDADEGRKMDAKDEVEMDDDDDVIGPALPGMKGFRVPDQRVEDEVARQAKALEEKEWKRIRGDTSESPKVETLKREEWMTQAPQGSSILRDVMESSMQRRSNQPAAFRGKEPIAVDQSWFASPEERERAQRAALDMQLLGCVRPENYSQAPVEAPETRRAVHESIVPSKNDQADEDMRQQMDTLRQKRGPSLLDQYQKRRDEEKKTKQSPGAAGWDRERDVVVRKGLSREDADRIVQASQQIGSRFTAPSVTRQFL